MYPLARETSESDATNYVLKTMTYNNDLSVISHRSSVFPIRHGRLFFPPVHCLACQLITAPQTDVWVGSSGGNVMRTVHTVLQIESGNGVPSSNDVTHVNVATCVDAHDSTYCTCQQAQHIPSPPTSTASESFKAAEKEKEKTKIKYRLYSSRHTSTLHNNVNNSNNNSAQVQRRTSRQVVSSCILWYISTWGDEQERDEKGKKMKRGKWK